MRGIYFAPSTATNIVRGMTSVASAQGVCAGGRRVTGPLIAQDLPSVVEPRPGTGQDGGPAPAHWGHGQGGRFFLRWSFCRTRQKWASRPRVMG